MKTFKEILLEKLKVSKNSNNYYEYETDYWDRDMFEHAITFIIYNDDINDSFFDNNPEEKIPESCLAFYPEDEDGNDIDYNGLFEYCNGKKIKEIPIEEEDVEQVFGQLDYSDSVNIYYYGNRPKNVKTIIYEMYSDGVWYYSIFGDKEIDKIINLFPPNLVEVEDNKHFLKQAAEIQLEQQR